MKHIVIFKISEELAASELQKFCDELNALTKTVPALRSMQAAVNVNPKEGYGFGLIAECDDLEGVAAYAQHPDHQAIVARLKPYIVSRSCIDF